MTEATKNAKEKVENNRRLLAAEKLAHLGHWQVDIQAQQVAWSDEIYAIHGVTKQQYKPELSSAIDFYHPDDKDKVSHYVNEAIETGKGWVFKLRILRPNGEIRHILSRGEVKFDKCNKPQQIFGTFQDITELSVLLIENDLLKKAVDETTSGIVITDPGKKVVWVNKGFSRMTGYTPDEVIGRSLKLFLQGEDTNKETVNELAVALAHGQAIDVDILNYRKDQKKYWNNLKISPMRRDGVITHFVGIQHDVTEKREQSDVIRKMQRLDMVGQLSAGIAHDFNNILAIISGYREIGEERNTQPELNKVFNNIGKAVSRAENLTSRLLKTTKESPLNTNIKPLKDIIGDLKGILSEAVPKNITISWDVDESIDQGVDLNDIQDAVLNLVINAKNSISGSGNISVTVKRTEKFNCADDYIVVEPSRSSEYIEIHIKDNGCGIPKDKFDDIFSPFESYSSVSGTGLGLAMVLGFVTRYKYGLAINSNVGKGTCFSISIPMTTLEINAQSPNAIYSTPKVDTLTVVLIDDEVELAKVAALLLESMGHNVLIFNIPSEACRYIESNMASIDLVITDEVMPGEMQGHDLMKRFSTLIPMILVSGYSKLADVEDYNEYLLAKPFRREALASKISSTLESFASQQVDPN